VYGEQVKSQKSKNSLEKTSLNGVSKIVTKENGKSLCYSFDFALLLFAIKTYFCNLTLNRHLFFALILGVSGMFQYFIKIVPTSYKGRNIVREIDPNFSMGKEPQLETNRYFVNERFTPLVEVEDEHLKLGKLVDADDDETKYAGAKVGGKSGLSHDKHEQHLTQKAILPGVFFIYQVYPFAVEISKGYVPFTHLLIRILATVGGVFTLVGWLDAVVCSRNKRHKAQSS
jgi:hypothetical protein